MLKICLPFWPPFQIKELNRMFKYWQLLVWCFTLNPVGVEGRRQDFPSEPGETCLLGFEFLANDWLQLWWKLNINPHLFRNTCLTFLTPGSWFLQLCMETSSFQKCQMTLQGIHFSLLVQQNFTVWCMETVWAVLHVISWLGYDCVSMMTTK